MAVVICWLLAVVRAKLGSGCVYACVATNQEHNNENCSCTDNLIGYRLYISTKNISIRYQLFRPRISISTKNINISYRQCYKMYISTQNFRDNDEKIVCEICNER